jgi:hypothetical protein
MKTNYLDLSGRLLDIVEMMKEETFESGKLNASDYEFESILKEQSFHPEDVHFLVFNLYLRRSNDVKTKILNMISRIQYKKLAKLYYDIAKLGLDNKDDEIFEAAVRCFENWEYLTPKLKGINLKGRPKWLKDYVLTVIIDLTDLKELAK